LNRVLIILAASALILSVGISVSQADAPISVGTNCKKDCFACHSLSIQEATEIVRPLGVVVRKVMQSPILGIFEVLAERDGKEGLIFVDYGKKHLMQGVMVKVSDLDAASTDKNKLGPRLKSQ
jgi:thiol:disulfide interchange protein DsbC